MKEGIKKRKKVNTVKKKKFSFKLLIGFLIFELIFTGITGPILLLYGPFETAKKTFLGTATASMHYGWVATMFMSQEKIDKILGTGDETSDEEILSSEGLVKLPTVDNSNIKYYTIEGIEGAKFNGYVLEIANPKRVKIGYSSKLGVEGEKTSEIAENNNAVAGINGGAFMDKTDGEAWTQNGGIPTGLIISEGKEVFSDVTNKDTKLPCALINKDGLLIGGNYSYNEIQKMNIKEGLTFGPLLISGGRKISNLADTGTSPKTLIGQKEDGTMVLVVLDSNTETRMCANLREAQNVMYKLGCVTAINLDGGKSTTMYYDGEVVNNPSNAAGERAIASGFIVK